MAGDFLDDAPQGAVATIPQAELPALQNMSPQMQGAVMLHESGLFPNTGSVAGIYTVVQYGKEIGLPPVQALNNVAIINGKLSMSGASMLALGYKHGVKAKFLQEDNESCRIQFTREGYEPYISEFTIKDAETANLGDRDKATGKLKPSSVWFKYTKTMLKWRAVAQGMRMIAPDVLAGVYTQDEIVNITDVTLNDTADIADTPEHVAQKDTPKEEAQPTEVVDDSKITEGQMKRLHALIAEKGVTPFREGFKLFLLTFDGTGMTPDKPSATELDKEFTSTLLADFKKYASMFFASPKSRTYLDGVFGGLERKAKAQVIAGMKSMVEGGSSFPIEVKDDTPDKMISDWFGLMITALSNQEQNRVAEAGKEKGMSTDEVVDTLQELGMEPEVVDRTEVPKETKKEEPKQEKKEDDEFLNF